MLLMSLNTYVPAGEMIENIEFNKFWLTEKVIHDIQRYVSLFWATNINNPFFKKDLR